MVVPESSVASRAVYEPLDKVRHQLDSGVSTNDS